MPLPGVTLAEVTGDTLTPCNVRPMFGITSHLIPAPLIAFEKCDASIDTYELPANPFQLAGVLELLALISLDWEPAGFVISEVPTSSSSGNTSLSGCCQ